MLTNDPFTALTAFLPPIVMQLYIVLMVLAVAAGTLFDVLHKSSAKFFAQQWKKSRASAQRPVGSAETVSLALRTILKEVATSGEFCNTKRRVSHLLMFYGFLLYLVTTLVMVFGYPTQAAPTPPVWPVLWNIGILMVLIGGSWFFFFIRVDVAHEGRSPFRLMRADLFIVSLLASVACALLWEVVQTAGNLAATKLFFALYIFFATLLFVSVPWSKFAHMFYKPVVAFQKRVQEASGSSDLPAPADDRDGRM